MTILAGLDKGRVVFKYRPENFIVEEIHLAKQSFLR